MTEQRPDPDALLERVMQQEAEAARGRLKIFFGSSAGVGKTFAMLAAAKKAKEEGVDVVIGLVETHGRAETARMIGDLEVLPRKNVAYRGRMLTEFDLDAALARRPQLMLVDELAHSNLEGSRHPKRWQDVEELLVAGIDVYTSLNVQHLESLNDVVGQITQIRVQETLPDFVFDRADEVTLVDLPAEELLQRLKEGKVYLAEQAAQAIQHFFRKGNLIALRELALRRTADRVDAQMREYRADQSINRVWQAKERLLVCIAPDDTNGLVRNAARLAASLHADWIVVYVETPKLQQLNAASRQQVHDTLRLAQQLGAETQTLAGSDLIGVISNYARSRNASKIVVAKSRRSRLAQLWRPSLSEQLASGLVEMDVYVIGSQSEAETERDPLRYQSMETATAKARQRQLRTGLLWSLALTSLASLLAWPVWWHFDLTNAAMVYLLGVVVVSALFGRWPGVISSLLSVISFDFFYVPPRFSFAVSDTQYLLSFAVMLVVALTISSLTSNIRFQAHVARQRERRTASLYHLSKELASALSYDQILETGVRYIEYEFRCKAAILLPDSHEKVRQPVIDAKREASWPQIESSVAQWVYDHQSMAGLGTDTLPSYPARYLPLKAPMRTRGVLVLEATEPLQLMLQPEQQQLLDTAASQIALAIERVHYVEVAHDTLVSMESERLRNALLEAISHDLRTPLTVIVGLASSLRGLPSAASQAQIVADIETEALKMNGLVSNLLEMAHLQSGSIHLNLQWQMLEEVVGSALRLSRRQLGERQVSVALSAQLPLIAFDAVLLERVLCNLLENVAKYTPSTTHIQISAQLENERLILSVSNNGPPIPDGMEERIFVKFLRGERESKTTGVGVGLAICRAIIEAHQGRIWAENTTPSGVAFHIALPLGVPPALEELEELNHD